MEMDSGDGVDEDFDEEEILGEEDIDSELTPQEEEAALGGSAIKMKDVCIYIICVCMFVFAMNIT